MDFGDLVHGPFDTREYIEYLGGMFGYAFTLDTYSMLPQFFGHEEEDPCLHLDRFEAVCGLCDDVRMSKRLRFMFFPLSLQSVAGDWCYNFGEWTTWDQCVQAFIKHFLPIHQNFTHGLQIRNFYQKKGEVFYKCWERFNILLDTFPSHGLELGDIIAILYNALFHELHQAFDLVLGKEFLDLTPGEAWSFLEFFYEHTRPREKLETRFEPYVLESHTDLFPHAPTSLDPHDPSLGSSVCVEPDYSDFACPNLVPLTEGQSEEPRDYWPSEPYDAQFETIGTEWATCPDHARDDVWDECLSHLPVDFPIQEISLPPFESQGDMQSFPPTEFDALPTQTTMGPIESLLTPIEHLNIACPEEHIIESVDPSSLHYTTKVESGAHLPSLDLVPSEKFTSGNVSDHVTDHHWEEVVDTGKAGIDFLGVERSFEPTISTPIDFLGIERLIEPTISTSVDFLGVKRLIEPTMSTPALTLWPHPRFQEPHLALHSSVCFTPERYSYSVLHGPTENILFLKPFVDAWDREGVG